MRINPLGVIGIMQAAAITMTLYLTMKKADFGVYLEDIVDLSVDTQE